MLTSLFRKMLRQLMKKMELAGSTGTLKTVAKGNFAKPLQVSVSRA